MEIDNLKSASIVHNDFDFVNKRRGAFIADLDYLDSGPMALQQQPKSASKENSPNSLSQSFISDYFPKYVGMQKKQISTREINNGAVGAKRTSTSSMHMTDNLSARDAVSLTQRPDSYAPSSARVIEQPNEQCKTPTAGPNLINSNNNHTFSRVIERKTMADTVKASNEGKEIVGDGWKLVMKKKKTKHISSGMIGKADVGPEGKFKVAIMKIPLFISNVNKQTHESDIVAYIKDNTQEDVTLYKINRKTEKSYNSYKLYVPKTKLDIFLDKNLLPKELIPFVDLLMSVTCRRAAY